MRKGHYLVITQNKQPQPSAYLERPSYGDSLYGSCGSHLALGRTPGTEPKQHRHYRDSHKQTEQHTHHIMTDIQVYNPLSASLKCEKL
jgi:hypothetical protein